jgi:hypothetical protein
MARYTAVVDASSQRMTERVFVAAPAITDRILLGASRSCKRGLAVGYGRRFDCRGFVRGEARCGAQTGLVPVESGAAVQSAASRSERARELPWAGGRNRRVGCLDVPADVAGVG